MEALLNNFSKVDAAGIAHCALEQGTAVYIYDESAILDRCNDCLSMPNAYGLTVRFAMKANSNRTLLKIISGAGLKIDASSMNEVIRANLAGIPYDDIMLTTQEVHAGADRLKLEELLLKGLKYNVCSLRQLRLVADFAAAEAIDLGMRIHPGIGSGESATRNTGDDYACFGVHISDFEEAMRIAGEKNIKFKHVHVHIGSGADPVIWQQNIDHELSLIKTYFHDVEKVSFGGGLKVARMPDENAADIEKLGSYAKQRIEEFYEMTGRKLEVEIEPGTYIVANCGYAVTRVIDKKSTSILNFVITDGGMEINARPLLYGSRHPVYIVAGDGASVKSSEWGETIGAYEAVIAGKCCESGDCQTLDSEGHPVARAMAEPEIGDFVVIGGTGAYCSTMTPYNYNSHGQIPEVLFTTDGQLKLIRKRQTLEQMLENEI